MCGDHDYRPARLVARFGNHVTGPQAWPRPEITCPLVTRLARGDSARLFGLRRIGKSSLMAMVRAELQRREDIVLVHADAQNATTLSVLVENLLQALPDKSLKTKVAGKLAGMAGIATGISAFFAGILEGKPVPLQTADETTFIAYWRNLAPAIGDELARHEKQVVICFDELPMLCERMVKMKDGAAAVNELFAELRRWRTFDERRVAMFFTGSIGLEGLAKAHGISRTALSDATVVRLPPLSPTEAEAMLRALIAGTADKPWADDMVRATLDRIEENHAGVIQYAFYNLHDRRVATVSDIEQAFRDVVRPGMQRDFFVQFGERLRRNEKELRRRLEFALAVIASAAAPAGIGGEAFLAAFQKQEPADEASDVIAILEEDGFVAHDVENRRLHLADGLVRAWWTGKQPFVPV